jgi:hypothetical protein
LEESKETTPITKPINSTESTNKEDTKVENVKSIQTDIDINLGSVTGASENSTKGET